MPPDATKEVAHHLYRSMLRTASYLPTPETRKWVSERITWRFRRKTFMTHEQHKNAQKLQRQISRATRGDIDALTKVLHYTYGRAGPRRRQLLDSVTSLLRNSDLANPPSHPPLSPPKPRVARLSPALNHGGRLSLPTKEPSPFLTAFQRFLVDQDTNGPSDLLGRNKIRFIDPPIPTENYFGRAMPIKRERGIVERWARDGLKNVVPPLPKGEWEDLRRIATGEVVAADPPKRRTKVGDWGWEDGSLLTLENLKYSIQYTHIPILRDKRDKMNEHIITPRFLQRLHAKVWRAAAKMEWNQELRKWIYTWGTENIRQTPAGAVHAGPRDAPLFEGLAVQDASRLRQEVKLNSSRKSRRKEAKLEEKFKRTDKWKLDEADGGSGGTW